VKTLPKLISELRDQEKPKISEGKRILLHFPHNDHGMHALMDVLNESEQSQVLGFQTLVWQNIPSYHTGQKRRHTDGNHT
jgi:hypothetical protein